MPKISTKTTILLPLLGVLTIAFAQDSATPPKAQSSSQGATTKSSATKSSTTKSATAGKAPLTTAKDKFSYGLGYNLGTSMHKQDVPMDPAIFMRGFKAGLAGAKGEMTDEEARAAIVAMQGDVRKKLEEKRNAEGAAAKKEGEAFLAQNKTKPGVKTTASGLQYQVIKEGDGPKPTASDSVVCNYRGTLINGKEFDSSYKRNEPATFPVGGVIKGWTEALQLMPVGSKWKLFIPADLAYGERGAGNDIPPDSTLIFEIELLKIAEKKPEAPGAPGAEGNPSGAPNGANPPAGQSTTPPPSNPTTPPPPDKK